MATTPKGDNASRDFMHLAPQQEQADDRPQDAFRLRDLPGAVPKVSGLRAHVGGEAGAFGKVLQVAQPGHESRRSAGGTSSAARMTTRAPHSEPSWGGMSINHASSAGPSGTDPSVSRYLVAARARRDRYGINCVLRNVTTFAPGTYASRRWIETELIRRPRGPLSRRHQCLRGTTFHGRLHRQSERDKTTHLTSSCSLHGAYESMGLGSSNLAWARSIGRQ